MTPNMFAVLSRFCFRYASFVLLFWVFVSAVSFVFALQKLIIDTNAPQHFSEQNASARDLAEFQRNFSEQTSLFEIYALSETVEDQKKVVGFLDAAIAQRTDLFRFGFSPGAGPYYEKYGLLYLPSAQLAHRIEILSAQAPLFRAIAASPNLDGLTILVNQVESSIALGRQPEGLERLFTEAAITVRSVLQGSSTAMDWRKVAHLNLENTSKSAIMLVAAQAGLESEASIFVEKWVEEIERTTNTKISLRYPANIKTVAMALQLPALSASVAICLFLFCFVIMGELRLTLMTVLPTFATISVTAAALGFFIPDVSAPFFGPMLGAFLGTLFLAATHTISLAQTSHLAGRWETVGMLTAQIHGLGLVLQSLAISIFWCCWLIWRDSETTRAVLFLVASQAIAILACFTIIPALCQFMIGRDQWRYQEFRQKIKTKMRGWMLPEATAVVICACMFSIFLFPTWLSRAPTNESSNEPSVQVIVQSENAARKLIADLAKTPGVTAARWLGAFLPPESAKSYLNGNSFVDLIPAANFSIPSGFEEANPERVANLEASLRAISDAKNISPALRASAHELRRSVSLLASTGQNIDIAIVQLENLLFSRFDELHSTIVALTDTRPLTMADLDPSLGALFQAKNGDFRIEIETTSAFSLMDFQQKLRNSGAKLISLKLIEKVEAEMRKVNFNWVTLLGLALSLFMYGLLADSLSTWGIVILSLALAIICLYILKQPIEALVGAQSHHIFAFVISALVAYGAGLCAVHEASPEAPYDGLIAMRPAVLSSGIASITCAYILTVPFGPVHILLIIATALLASSLFIFASLKAAFFKRTKAGL